MMSYDAITILSEVHDFDLGQYKSEMFGLSILWMSGDK